ncbi:hypothetical protein [Catellatospora citrea]|uniref:Uncharacterized protein n=1 Tax=Catellatospora citrea TaxID=53366 RepID=A0A8J3KBI3_9ACTN|nr:hypothetical protein [Catellatospora citrea]RKE11118.1 hypothetical protein C8E86_6040 [Catellatospora citrea]GIF96577.1 hypothetical protein Cci01nite_16710 [Catellatospora citrea]
MTAVFTFRQPIPGTPRNAEVVVHQAFISMLLWPSVPVTRRVDEDLTILDRLIVDAAITLDPVYPVDIEEITSIPQDAIVRAMGRLADLGLLEASGQGDYTATDKARQSLDQTSVPRLRPAHIPMLYLADTDELIALPAAHQQVQQLQRAQPVGMMDVDTDVRGIPMTELFNERLALRAIHGLPDDIVGIADSEDHVAVTAPQYRCSGHVRNRPDGVAQAHLQIISGGSKPVTFVLPHAESLADAWSQLEQQAEHACRSWGPTTAHRDGRTWTYKLDHAAAEEALKHDIRISQDSGLLISDDQNVVYARVRFTPDGPLAARLFALQHAAAEIHTKPAADATAHALAQAITTSTAKFSLGDGGELTPADVRTALWRSRHYQHVYALRRDEDFRDD